VLLFIQLNHEYGSIIPLYDKINPQTSGGSIHTLQVDVMFTDVVDVLIAQELGEMTFFSFENSEHESYRQYASV
jgi:hypothetical protein